MHQLRPCLLPL